MHCSKMPDLARFGFLATNRHLRVLSVNDQNFYGRPFENLIAGLRSNQTLHELNLTRTAPLSCSNIRSLADFIGSSDCHLRHLSLGMTWVLNAKEDPDYKGAVLPLLEGMMSNRSLTFFRVQERAGVCLASIASVEASLSRLLDSNDTIEMIRFGSPQPRELHPWTLLFVRANRDFKRKLVRASKEPSLWVDGLSRISQHLPSIFFIVRSNPALYADLARAR